MRLSWIIFFTLGLTACSFAPFVPIEQTTETTEASPSTVSYDITQSASTLTAIYQIGIGMSSDEVVKKLGVPARKDPSHIGVEWWIYNKDLEHYLQVGMQQGRVVTLFSNGASINVRGIRIGSPVSDLQKFLGTPPTSLSINPNLSINHNSLDEHPSYLYQNSVYTFSLDKAGGAKKVAGVRISTREHFASIALGLGYQISYLKKPSPLPTLTPQQRKTVEIAYNRQNIDMTNIARKRAGLPLLAWNDQVAQVARSHSADMADHHFFSHNSPSTGTPVERMKKAGIPWMATGENIAAHLLDGIEVHFAWMNSPGHRNNILQPQFQELGVGTVLSLPETPGMMLDTYFTQEFFTRRNK